MAAEVTAGLAARAPALLQGEGQALVTPDPLLSSLFPRQLGEVTQKASQRLGFLGGEGREHGLFSPLWVQETGETDTAVFPEFLRAIWAPRTSPKHSSHCHNKLHPKSPTKSPRKPSK